MRGSVKGPLNNVELASQELDAIELDEEENPYIQSFLNSCLLRTGGA